MQIPSIKVDFGAQFAGTLTTQHGQFLIGRDEQCLTPYDMFQAALAACFYATFLGIVEKKKLQFERAEITVESEKREEIPTTFKHVKLVMTLFGAVEGKGFQQAFDLAGKYCSIHETITKVCPVEIVLQYAK